MVKGQKVRIKIKGENFVFWFFSSFSLPTQAYTLSHYGGETRENTPFDPSPRCVHTNSHPHGGGGDSQHVQQQPGHLRQAIIYWLHSEIFE